MKTSITVVERVTAETPAYVSVESREQVQQAPGVNLDDRLRNIPGFSLFRRSSGVVAHPTTQGVTLRGIGPTGASRTLVRWDGVPVNDPFGGWVQWTRFAPDEIDRVEVSRGASTSVFGDRAMGGAISLFSRPSTANRLKGSYETGNRNTHDASAGFTRVWRRVAASAHGRGFTTNGYFIVPEAIRGAVDREANVRFAAGDAKIDLLGATNRLFLKFDLLAEERENGTVAQRNSTSLGTVSGHYFHETVASGVSVLGYHLREEFRSSFSAIAAGRNTERLTSLQTVPAEATGAAGLWRYSRRGWNALIGGDLHNVEGFSRDTALPAGTLNVSGGSLLQHGYFGQVNVPAGPANLFLGSRYHFADQGRRFYSPSAGIAAGRGVLRARASAYRSFRVPTLNELFREFRAGNAVTQANDQLDPESLAGVEAGFDLAGERTHFSVTAYRNSLEDLITNVTLSSSPTLIVRQRRNAAEALARGFEGSVRRRQGRWLAEAAYLFSDSRFGSRLRVPQAPRHQGSAQVTYSRSGTLATFGGRAFSSQFEDDANQFLMGGFGVLQFALQQRLTRQLTLLAAVENLLNREYTAGYTPARMIGAPRLWRAGLRWSPP
ncbi:MAG: TonB-dependent receptor [Bryobacteraceae bacterium]|nr:TonB-dependent receptor [Bryobacteraceae bacterium]